MKTKLRKKKKRSQQIKHETIKMKGSKKERKKLQGIKNFMNKDIGND